MCLQHQHYIMHRFPIKFNRIIQYYIPGQVVAAMNAAALRREKAASLSGPPRAEPEGLVKEKKDSVPKDSSH